ncbi:unnamed protein product [Ectocarpus sp. 8 AP-2014]
MNVDMDIEKLLRLEIELKSQCEDETSSVSLDAKVNILKYLQVQTVLQYQAAYDGLYFELNKEGGLVCLRNIAPGGSGDLLQPKVLELQDYGEDVRLTTQLQFYLADANLAKQCLDKLVAEVTQDLEKCKAQFVDVKSLESTRRKASIFCGGDVRKVADMARVTVICDTPEALEQAYLAIMGFLQPQDVVRVSNGFNSDWTPGGYRDVKLNPVVNQHLCEIQLQLRDFFSLKSGQHAVYTWARELKVTTEMRPESLFENLSPEVMEKMVHLARQNWHGSGYCLPDLQLAAGQYDLAEKVTRQVLSEAEDVKRGFEDHGSKEWREALLLVNGARLRLAVVLEKKGKYDEMGLQLERSLAFSMKELGPEHPDVAVALNNRAELLRVQGKYVEAEPLQERALAIREKTLGPDHPAVAESLNNGAALLGSQVRVLKGFSLHFRECYSEFLDATVTPKRLSVTLSTAFQGKYAEAESLYERATEIWEKALGPDHPTVANALNNRAGLLYKQGKYIEADLLYLRAVEIRELVLGADHPDVAVSLCTRGQLLTAQGDYAGAESLYRRAEDILEKSLGPNHPHVGTAISSRAVLLESQVRAQGNLRQFRRADMCQEKKSFVFDSLSCANPLSYTQGKYAEAEPLFERATEIWEKALGPDHPTVANALNNRAGLLYKQGKYIEADLLYLRAVEIRELVLGADHPDVAVSLCTRGQLLTAQGDYAGAESLYRRAEDILEKSLGPNHPHVGTAISSRAVLLDKQGNYAEADPLYLRAIEIWEAGLGPEHPNVASALNNRAVLLERQGKYEQADPLYVLAINIWEVALGPDHPEVAAALNNRAGLLQKQGNYDDAEPLYERSHAIREKVLGPEHPDVSQSLNNRAQLLENQGKYDEAAPLYERSLGIREKALGPEHPQVAELLNNRAALLRKQGKYVEAEPLFMRATEIWEKALDPDHPTVATVLNNRAALLYAQGKYKEAIPLFEKALSIRIEKLGGGHPDTIGSQNNLEIARQKVRAQLGRRVGKRQIYPTARRPGTTDNPSFGMAGVKTRSKPAEAVGHCKRDEHDKGKLPVWENHVKCDWRRIYI